MRLALVVLGGLALSVGAATTQAAPSDFLEGFKVEPVTEVLRATKGTDFKTEVVEGDPRITFKMGEIIVIADFYECENKAKGCEILQFMVAFEPDPTETVQAVNEFNKKYLYGKAALDDGLIAYRMVNGQAGSSKAQVAAEFDTFIGVLPVLLEHMKSSASVVQGPGDKAPAALNTAVTQGGPSTNSRWRSLPRSKR